MEHANNKIGFLSITLSAEKPIALLKEKKNVMCIVVYDHIKSHKPFSHRDNIHIKRQKLEVKKGVVPICPEK
jgi:hypothetical protein